MTRGSLEQPWSIDNVSPNCLQHSKRAPLYFVSPMPSHVQLCRRFDCHVRLSALVVAGTIEKTSRANDTNFAGRGWTRDTHPHQPHFMQQVLPPLLFLCRMSHVACRRATDHTRRTGGEALPSPIRETCGEAFLPPLLETLCPHSHCCTKIFAVLLKVH